MPPVDNHTLLIQLVDRVDTVGKTLGQFIESQGAENKAIHLRIDETNTRTAKAVESIKDGLADRGRVSGTFILTFSAVFLSLIAILGGAVHAYVSGRLETIEPTLTAHESTMQRDATALTAANEKVTQLREALAASAATAATDREWIKREMDRLSGTGKNAAP